MTTERFSVQEFIPDDVTPGYREYAAEALRRSVVNALYERFQFGKTYTITTNRRAEHVDYEVPYLCPGTKITIVGYLREEPQ